jgi:4-hydroxy-3-methylbut-2-enyl diphosphate reductase
MIEDNKKLNLNKNLYLASPRGFCAGVERAIKIVEQAIKIHGKPVYVKHEIVHNKHVVKRLSEDGAIFVESFENVPKNSIVIFSAHGVAKKVVNEAKEYDLNIFDATCPLVTKVHLEAIKLHNNGYHILLVGHDGHPEIEGTRGQVPEESITLIQNLKEAKNFITKEQKLAWLSQTTLSVDDTSEIVKTLTKRFPNIIGPKKGDICYATTNRQMAVKKIASNVEVMLIVGSENSSNSQRLVEVAKNEGCVNSYLVSDVNFIKWNEINNIKNIGLSSGASAPESLIEEIRSEFSKRYNIKEIQNLETKEDIYFKLPKALEN